MSSYNQNNVDELCAVSSEGRAQSETELDVQRYTNEGISHLADK